MSTFIARFYPGVSTFPISFPGLSVSEATDLMDTPCALAGERVSAYLKVVPVYGFEGDCALVRPGRVGDFSFFESFAEAADNYVSMFLYSAMDAVAHAARNSEKIAAGIPVRMMLFPQRTRVEVSAEEVAEKLLNTRQDLDLLVSKVASHLKHLRQDKEFDVAKATEAALDERLQWLRDATQRMLDDAAKGVRRGVRIRRPSVDKSTEEV